MKKYILALLLLFPLLFSFGAIGVQAQVSGGNNPSPVSGGNNPPVKVSLNNPFTVCGSSKTTTCGVRELLDAIIQKILMPIAGVLIVLAFIYVGFQFVVAQGDPGKIKTAKQSLKFVVIGTIILLGAAALTALISGTIDQFNSL